MLSAFCNSDLRATFRSQAPLYDHQTLVYQYAKK